MKYVWNVENSHLKENSNKKIKSCVCDKLFYYDEKSRNCLRKEKLNNLCTKQSLIVYSVMVVTSALNVSKILFMMINLIVVDVNQAFH